MDALDRMFSRLVYNLRNSFPELVGNPFEVSELYQTVIPYRHNRRELGLESNGDYELTLMALLSGARGYIVGEGRMQESLRAELAKPNPDTTLFRSFATARIAVATDALRRFDQMGESEAEELPPLGSASERSASSSRPADDSPFAPPPPPSGPGPRSQPQAFSHPLGEPLYPPPPRAAGREASRGTGLESVATDSSGNAMRSQPRESTREPVLERARQAREAAREVSREPAREPAREPDSGPRASIRSSPAQPTHEPPSMTTPTRSTTASALGGSCRYCGGTLPDGRRLVFCPHCGQNLTIQHCPACSTELELGWKFCTTCGRSVASS